MHQATAYSSVTSRPAGRLISRNSSSRIIGSSRSSSRGRSAWRGLQQLGLLLQQVQRDLRVQPDGELPLPVLVPRPLERPLQPPGHDLRREDPAGAGAGRAVGGHRVPERRPHPLPGHLDQAQLGHRERLGAGPVAAEVGAQLLQHLVAVGARLHVDEVADDDAADVAQPELPGDLARRLEVGPQDRLLGILLAGVAAGVDVDRDQRLGRLDDQLAAGRQLAPGLEQVADLGLDVELVEQRRRLVVQLHPARSARGRPARGTARSRCRARFESTDSASTLALKRSRMMPRVRLVSRCSSAGARRTKRLLRLICFQSAEQRSISRWKCSSVTPSATVRTITPPASLGSSSVTISRSLRPLLPALDLAAHADLGGVRHVDEEPAGERDLRGDPAALGADRLLGDLDQEGLALLQDVLDVRGRRGGDATSRWRALGGGGARCRPRRPRSRRRRPPSARPAPLRHRASAFGVRGSASRSASLLGLFGGILVLVGLEQVGGVEEGALLLPDVHEGRLDAGQDRLDPAE